MPSDTSVFETLFTTEALIGSLYFVFIGLYVSQHAGAGNTPTELVTQQEKNLLRFVMVLIGFTFSGVGVLLALSSTTNIATYGLSAAVGVATCFVIFTMILVLIHGLLLYRRYVSRPRPQPKKLTH